MKNRGSQPEPANSRSVVQVVQDKPQTADGRIITMQWKGCGKLEVPAKSSVLSLVTQRHRWPQPNAYPGWSAGQ